MSSTPCANWLADFDAVIFEDYGKGFLDAGTCRRDLEFCRAAGKIVTADPNPRHSIAWRNVTAVKPNRSEAFQAAGVPVQDPADDPQTDAALLARGRGT